MSNIAESKLARDASNFQHFSRRATAISSYSKAGFNIEKSLDHMRGIDFTQPVDFITLPEGTEVEQYMFSGQSNPGNYFTPVETPGNTLGIYTSGRSPVRFFASKDIQVLRSTTFPMVDDYSMSEYGWEIETEGGSTQYFGPSLDVWRMK